MIRVPRAIWADTVRQFMECGAGKRECVVYWTAPADVLDAVDEAVHPDHIASAGYYEVSEAWFHKFWLSLADRRRSVRMQVHTHGGRAFHSGTDDEGAIVQAPGYLSLVIPRFAISSDPLTGAFLARLDERGRFVEVPIDEHLDFGVVRKN